MYYFDVAKPWKDILLQLFLVMSPLNPPCHNSSQQAGNRNTQFLIPCGVRFLIILSLFQLCLPFSTYKLLFEVLFTREVKKIL